MNLGCEFLLNIAQEQGWLQNSGHFRKLVEKVSIVKINSINYNENSIKETVPVTRMALKLRLTRIGIVR